MNEEQLMAVLETLKQAPQCTKHGRTHLVICMECLEDVRCTVCNPQACQCWNDE